MTAQHFRDNSPAATLQAPIDADDTSVTVDSAAGMPTSFNFPATIDRGTASAEQVQVTNIVGTTVTITRNENGLGAFSHLAGAKLEHTANAKNFQKADDHVEADSGVHGVTGDVVGTTDEQTLTNKTFEGLSVTATGGTPGVLIDAALGTDLPIKITRSAATKFTVDGNGKLTGDDAVLGDISAATVSTTGDATIGGDADITGDVGAANAAFTGNETVGGTLGVTGASTLHAVTATSLHATGDSNLDGALAVGGDAAITGDVSANDATFSGTLGATGAATLHAVSATTVHATGDATLDANASVGGDLTVTGHVAATGDVTAKGGISMPRGILKKVTTSSNGDQTSGTTEAKDGALGDLVFTADSTRQYELIWAGCGLNGNQADDRFSVTARDGGASSPTSGSAQVGHNTTAVIVAATDVDTHGLSTLCTFTSGTHTINIFFKRVQGSGVATPTGNRELYIKDIGAIPS